MAKKRRRASIEQVEPGFLALVGAFEDEPEYVDSLADVVRGRGGLATEARSLMQDPRYVGETHEVAGLMEQLRGPAPEDL